MWRWQLESPWSNQCNPGHHLILAQVPLDHLARQFDRLVFGWQRFLGDRAEAEYHLRFDRDGVFEINQPVTFAEDGQVILADDDSRAGGVGFETIGEESVDLLEGGSGG